MTIATVSRSGGVDLVPVQLDLLSDIDPAVLVARLGDHVTARRWLREVLDLTPSVLESHIELGQLVVLLEQALPGSAVPGSMDVEAALAGHDWQTAYDLAMATTEGSARALAGLLLVADGLHAAGQSTAALNLLGRALEVYERTPAVYWALIQILAQQGRIDDAQAALELLRDAMRVD